MILSILDHGCSAVISTIDIAVISGNRDTGVSDRREQHEDENEGSLGWGTSQSIRRAQERDALAELHHDTNLCFLLQTSLSQKHPGSRGSELVPMCFSGAGGSLGSWHEGENRE